MFSIIHQYSVGPICRHQLRENEVYHVSYNLEEASRLFQAIKNTIDWSTVKLPTASVISHDQNSTLQTIHRDEIYARQVQAELNRAAVNGSARRTRVGRENQALPTQQVTTGQAEPVIDRHIGHQKTCGHRCDLVTTRQCCVCSGKIVVIKDFLLHSLICFYLNHIFNRPTTTACRI